jgi:serine phosphatase RsbU (regulator of sigma subunit)/ligand-binding sensor domain-containing protein
MFKKLILGLILFINPCFLIAQEENSSLVTFTEKDGIPSNSITSVIQDHLGFIWISTSNGLLKYDGYKFQRYDLNHFHPHTSTVFEDSELNLWIGVVGGVIKYNRINEKFRFYSLGSVSIHLDKGFLMISEIEEDIFGTFWFGVGDLFGSNVEDGLVYLRKGENQLQKFSTENDSVTIQSLYNIEIDYRNNLWLSGKGGLGKIDLKSMSFEKIYFKNNPIHSFNTSILIDKNGILWGGQWEVGFGSYDPSNGNLKTYSFDSSNSTSISNNNITSIFKDKDGTLWLSTVNGINQFDPKTEKFTRYFHDKALNRNYTNIGIVRAIMKDESGSIWLATDENFLNKFDPSKKLFKSYKHDPDDVTSISPGWIFSLEEDNKGNIWIGSNPDEFTSGLSKYNPRSNSFTRFPNSGNTWPGILSINIDSEQTIWIGSYNSGLLTFNPDNNLFTKVDVSYQGLSSVPAIADIFKDHSLNFWIGTSRGLFLLDKSSREAKRITIDTARSNSGLSVDIQHIIESQKNELWIGTPHGLYNYNHIKNKSKRYFHDPKNSNGLINSNIGYIFEDEDEILWLASWGGGLIKFDPESEIFTHYTMKDGLPSNNVQGILKDENNNALWLSTFEGLSRFDLLTKEFRNFDASHGVQGKQFARTSALETTKGEFLFGGANGLNIFHPNDVLTNLIPPDILISDFKIFNKSVPVGDNSPLQKPIYQTEEIILASDENDISIDFLATHFVDPSHNEYAYLLENYENEWRYVGNSHSAIYPNLPPGKYIFRVKAANNSGVWNNEGKSLNIIVLSPWWQTIWAYAGYGLILVLGIFAVDRFQRKRILLKERNAAAIKEAQFRAKIAEADNERKSRELEEARQLQLSMLPKDVPQLPHFDIAVYMQTATEVGGDYYDFSTNEDGSLNIAIGDATGHGMKAGIMVSSMKSIFTTNSPKMDIEPFFDTANKGVKSMRLQRMMMGFSMLNINKNEFRLINAGMPPVFLFRKRSESVEEITEHGMPIGAMKLSNYNVVNKELHNGDVLLLMSDGLPELLNEKEEMYGYDRIRNGFKSVAKKSPVEIISYFKNEGSSWANGQAPDDDVTFVVIKVK